MAKRSTSKIWIAVFLVLATIGLYFYSLDRSKTPSPESMDHPGQRYVLEKTGAGATADFSAAAKKIHAAVDEAAAQAGTQAKDVKAETKEVKRQQVEGTIRWHVRQFVVQMPDGRTANELQNTLAAAIKKAGGEILAVQSDTYQGYSVTRIDVGLKDTLDGDVVTITTDKLFVQQGQTSTGPVKSSDGTVRGQLALIIDDFGYSGEAIEAFAAIDRPLTFAVLPYRPYSNQSATRGLSSGHQVMLHLPMEPLSAGAQSESITIGVSMTESEIRDITAKAVEAVPGIVGVNNHQGSRATADERVMRAVLSVLKEDNLFFVDSHTSSQTVGRNTARRVGVRTGINDIFIDNSSEVGAIKRQLRTACGMALQNGSAIAIGHARMSTATAVREMIPEIEAQGIRLVFVSELVY